MISHKSIATLGIGFGTLAVASIGLLTPEAVQPPVVQPIQVQQAAGGAGRDSGRVVFKTTRPDLAWVRLLHGSKFSGTAHKPAVKTSSAGKLKGEFFGIKTCDVTTTSLAVSTLELSSLYARTNTYEVESSSGVKLNSSSLQSNCAKPLVEYLEIAELMVLLNEI